MQNILPDVPTPFHIYDEKGIREKRPPDQQGVQLEQRLQGVLCRQGPCPTPISCRSCGKRAAAWDCSSLTELMLSEAVGFSGDEIMFSSNQTPART